MALQVMSRGYNSTVLTFPGRKLQEILLYKDINKVKEDCKLFGLICIDENVLFQKTNFKDEVQLVSYRVNVRSENTFLFQCILS